MVAVKQSLKARSFGEPVDTGGIDVKKRLADSARKLISAKTKHPASRHLWEGLGWVYRELYQHTEDRAYLREALSALLVAEELGLKHHGTTLQKAHYADAVSDLCSEMGDKATLDDYFRRMIELFPDDEDLPLYYAISLAKFGDETADSYYQKAVASRQQGKFNAVVYYAEYLLDRQRNEDALHVLQVLDSFEDQAFYPHFLKGVALERLGKLDAAREEYGKYLEFKEPGYDPKTYNGPFMPSPRYRIPGSKIQGGIPFKTDLSTSGAEILATARRATPLCTSTDWACKARYYMV